VICVLAASCPHSDTPKREIKETCRPKRRHETLIPVPKVV
jgi:hypothetical protein